MAPVKVIALLAFAAIAVATSTPAPPKETPPPASTAAPAAHATEAAPTVTAPPRPPPPTDGPAGSASAPATTTTTTTAPAAPCGCLQLAVCPCRRELVEATVVDCLCAGQPSCGCQASVAAAPSCACAGQPSCGCQASTVGTPVVNVAGSPFVSFGPASFGNPTTMGPETQNLVHHVGAVNVPHQDAPSLVYAPGTKDAYQPEHAVDLKTSQLSGSIQFVATAGCPCINKPVCACRPAGSLINPAPEYVEPREKKMVNATFKEHVRPEEKRATTGFGVAKIRPNCCGPTGRKCRGLPPCGLTTSCGCSQLVEAQVLEPAQCPCMAAVTVSAPSALLSNVAVVNGDVVRQDVVKPFN